MQNYTRRRIIAVLEGLAGGILPLLFWMLLIFGFDTPYVAVLTIIAAIIHELGHSLAIIALSGTGHIPCAHISGFRIKRNECLGYKEEILILLMGPFFNIAAFAISIPFLGYMDGYIKIFAGINLMTALSNLLPVESYDGYGALKLIFTMTESETPLRLIEFISFSICLIISFLSLYLINKFGSGYWIFGVFFFMMLTKLVKFGKDSIFEE